MAADRPEGSNLEQSIAKRMGNRLRRMFGLENLHDGSREDYEEAHEAIPEGGRPLQAETMPGRAGTASSLPDAGLSRPWSSDFEPFPTPGSGGGQSQGISGGGESGSAGTGLEAAGLAGGAAHTAPSGGSGPGHASPSGGGTGGGGGNSGAHTGPNGGPMSPLSSSSTGFKGETHRPITDKDEQVTGDEDKPVRGTVIENPISSEGKLLVLKSFTIEGFPTTHTPGKQPVSIPGIGTFVVDPLGNYSFTPAPNWNGQVPTIHYTVTDGYSTDNSALKINIKPIDDSFTDQSEKFVYDEDSGQHFGNLLKGSSSPDGSLSIKSFSVDGQTGTPGQTITIQGKGTLTINSNGTFEFESAPNYNGPIPQATYTVTDGSGKDVQSTLNINVKPADDSFTDNSETFTYKEDSGKHSGDLLKGSSSPDGPLSIVSFSVDGQTGTPGQTITIQGKGTLTINSNGTFEFESAPNYNGPIPQATYTVTDGSGKDVQSTLNINVKPADDSFTDNSEKFIYDEDSGKHSGDLLKGSSSPDGPLSIVSFSVDGQTGTPGQTITIQGKGTLTINSNGNFEFESAPNYNGPIPQATYTVTDGSGKDVQSTLNITVNPVDDPSTLNPDNKTIDEDHTATGNVLGNDTDIDNTLTVTSFQVQGQQQSIQAGSSANITGVGSLSINPDGSYTFTPEPNYNGTVPTVSYTTNTGQTSTLNITVNPVDDPSTLNPDNKTIDEDHTATGNVLGNDTDIDNTLTVTSFQVQGQQQSIQAGSSANITGVGSLSINPDGSYTFTPEPNYNGTVPTVSYTTNTGQTSTLNITVNPVDDPSTLNPDNKTIDEDHTATGNVLGNDTDIDNTLTVTSFQVQGQQQSIQAGSSANITGVGSLSINPDGSYTFTPEPNYNGTVPTVSYTTNTGQTSTLNITVNPVDDPSTLNPDNKTIDEDHTATGNVLGNDTDIDNTLTVTSFQVQGQQQSIQAGSSANITGVGSLSINPDGSYTFTPEPNYNGTVPTVSYTTNTGQTSTLNITVNPVDDPSTLNPDNKTIDEDHTATGNVLGNDTDIDNTLTVTSFQVQGQQQSIQAGSSANITGVGSLSINPDGSYTFTPEPNYNGTVPTVSYTTNTGQTSTLNITVNPVDDPSTLNPDNKTIDEDHTATGNVLGNDTDIDNTLTVTSFQVQGQQQSIQAGSSANITGVGSLSINPDGSYTFTPEPNYNGTVPTVSYTTNTGQTSTLNITVNPVDDPSTLNPDNKTIDEDHTATGNVLGNDTDIDNTLTVTSFQVQGQQQSIQAGSSANITGVGSLSINPDGSYTFTPEPNYNGTVPTVSYTTNTGQTSTLNITVNPVDDPSTLNPDNKTIDEDHTATGNVLGNDTDIDNTLTVTSFQVQGQQQSIQAGSSANITGVGSLSINPDGSYTFTPEPNYNGTVPTVSYTTNTGQTSTLNITVNPVDDPSTLNPDNKTIDEDHTATGNVLGNDTDIDNTLTVTSFQVQGQQQSIQAGSSANITGVGSLSINPDGSYTFTPEPNYNGTVPTVSYTTNTGQTSTLNITVNPVDDPSTLNPDNKTIDEDHTATGNVLGNDTDIDNTLTVTSFQVQGQQQSIQAGSSANITGVGSLSINPDGSYTFTPEPNYNGTVPTVSYTTNTGQTSTLNITVNPVDDPSTLNPDNKTIDEDHTATGNVLGNDTDIDNTLTVTSFQVQGQQQSIQAGSSANITGVGSLSINPDGSYTFTPEPNYNGTVPTVSYTTNTGQTSTLNITVNPAPPTYTKPPEPTHPGGEVHLTGGSGIPAGGGTVGSHNFGGNNSPGQWTIVPITQERVTGSATAAGMFGTAHIDSTGRVGYDLKSQFALQHLIPPPNGKGAASTLTAAQLGGIDLLHKLGHPKTSITLQTNSFTDVFAVYKDGNLVGFWVASWNQNIQAYRHDMGHAPRYLGGITDFKSWDLAPSAYPDYHPAPPPHGSTRMGQVHQRDAETSDFSDELNAQIAALEAAGIYLTEKAEVKEFLGTTMLIVHTDHGDLVQAITNYADASPLRTIDPSGLDEEAQKALSDAGYPSTISEDAPNNDSGTNQEPLPADDTTRELLDGLQSLGLLDPSNPTETNQETQENGSLITTLTTHTNHGDIIQTITAAGNGEQLILKVDASGLDPETQQALQDSLRSSQEPGTSPNKLPNGQEGAEESKPEPLIIDGAALTSAIQEIQKLDPEALAAMHSGHNPDETNEQVDASTPTPLDANEVPVSSSNDVFSEETNSKRSNPAETAPPEDDQDLTTGGELPSDTQQDESLFNL